MSDKPPKIKRRRPFIFWVALVIITCGIVYPLSFGPACWLDSRRIPESKAVTASKSLNAFYYPIIDLVHRLDNDVGDKILLYAELFAADERQAQVAVLGPRGARTGKTWLVWIRRDLRPGPWINATLIPDKNDGAAAGPRAPGPDDTPES
jgi:hypothetical protein